MSWRFRKSFKVIPGVKLNLTTRGLSATIGAAPFSVNVGPRGVYRNVSIPGTGLWNRERIDVPSREHPGVHPSLPDTSPPPIPPSYPVSPAPASEIHSASTEILTSESLEQLRELLTDAYTEQNELTSEIATAESEAKDATRRYERWDRGFIFKNVFKKSFAARREAAETARAKLEELHEQLRLTKIATDINIDHEQAEPYSQMRDKFAILSESKAIWNVLSEQEIDRVAARSHASSEITRTPVSFSLGACDLIDWEQKVPHLPNRTGGDMYMYPGFILYRASKQAFALIDFRDVMLRFVSTQFTERDQIPSDSEIVGFTWAKCNKDGTPDRRFRDNYQIPLAHYGGLLFSTRDGLDVRYLCSNARSADEFVKAWEVFHSSYQCNQEKLSIDSLSHDDLNAISKARQALANLQAAFANFSSLNKTFVEKLVEVAKQHEDEARSEARFSVKEFQAYTSSVRQLIDAAKEFERTATIASNAARSKFRSAIQVLEAKFGDFVPSNDRTNGDALPAYLSAATEYLKAQNEFQNTVASAAERRAKKRGPRAR